MRYLVVSIIYGKCSRLIQERAMTAETKEKTQVKEILIWRINITKIVTLT